MPKLKPITEISNDDLLKLLDGNESSTESFEYKNDVLDFISKYGITNGKKKVKYQLLYSLYKSWSENPVHSRTFNMELEDLFNREKKFFLINRTPLTLKKAKYNFQKVNSQKISIRFSQHYQNYLKKYNIKSGGLFIKDEVLYNLYDKWIYSTKVKSFLTFFQFIRLCKLYFKHKMINRSYWFKIDHSIQTHLNENLIALMKNTKRGRN